ncbi:hypothetical protein [Streptomyces sp. NPDC057107]|uniref:hypothetical protein n=1 Tax=Streptomyces sp. NPDC057107 TaxID=3346021 RepID=UPI0036344A43
MEEWAPGRPAELPRRSWTAVPRGTLREFKDGELADRAAAPANCGVLALIPALLVLEFDAELVRRRAPLGGEPYVKPRDTRARSDGDRRLMEQ